MTKHSDQKHTTCSKSPGTKHHQRVAVKSRSRPRTRQSPAPSVPRAARLLIAAIARGRRWLEQLNTDPTQPKAIAKRAGCSARKVNKTISLAFLAPDLVKAAIEGRLPRGWEWRASATCPPNGLVNARCWALPRGSTIVGPVSACRGLCFRETRFRAREGGAKIAPQFKSLFAETQTQRTRPRQWRAIRRLRKTLFTFDCVVDLRGLELRARHAVLSNRSLRYR